MVKSRLSGGVKGAWSDVKQSIIIHKVVRVLCIACSVCVIYRSDAQSLSARAYVCNRLVMRVYVCWCQDTQYEVVSLYGSRVCGGVVCAWTKYNRFILHNIFSGFIRSIEILMESCVICEHAYYILGNYIEFLFSAGVYCCVDSGLWRRWSDRRVCRR